MARKLAAVVVLFGALVGAGPAMTATSAGASEGPTWAECWDGVRADGGDPRAGRIHRLYSAYFLRAPDHSGMTYWVDLSRRQLSIHRISGQFAASAEFRSTYGSLSNAEFVDLVYRNVMERTADAAGRAHWTDVLDRGALSRGGVMLSFADSAEYIARTGTTPPTERCPIPSPHPGPLRTQISHAAAELPGSRDLGPIPAGLHGARVHYDTPTAFAATWTRESFRASPYDEPCALLWVCVAELAAAQGQLVRIHDDLFQQLRGAAEFASGTPTDIYGDVVGPTVRMTLGIHPPGASQPRWEHRVEILDANTVYAELWAVVPGTRTPFEWGM